MRMTGARGAPPAVPSMPEPPADGVRLNLGCGFDLRPGWVNVDLHDFHKPDLVCDITWLRSVESESVDYVLAQDVLEHIHRVRCHTALMEWNRVLKLGGEIAVRVPDVTALADMLRRPDYATAQGQRHLLQNMFGTQSYDGDFHFNGFTTLSIRHDFESCGFEILHLGHKDEWLFEVLGRKVDHREPDEILRIGSDEAFIEEAYQRYLGRPSDPEGRNYFLGAVGKGVPREAVIETLKAA